MVDNRLCKNKRCSNIVTEVNKKTKEYKKYCCNECRYAGHSDTMIKHPHSGDAPMCAYHLCGEHVEKKTTGRWKLYCSPQCQNKHTAYAGSDESKSSPPICKHTDCFNSVTIGRFGHWHTYCSRKCAGQFNSISTRDSAKVTCQTRYGVDNPFQLDSVKLKSRKTNKIKYGAEYATQNPDILDKAIRASYCLKDYALPSGITVKIQGYENYALDTLFRDGHSETSILIEKKNVPQIRYVFNGTNRIYFPDIFIPTLDLIIEVKSLFTYERHLTLNLLKRQACIDAGYNFKFMIFDKIGNLLEEV